MGTPRFRSTFCQTLTCRINSYEVGYEMLPIIGVAVTGLGAVALFVGTLRIGARAPQSTVRK